LPQVAWLFNLRGSDAQCNPVFLSYATVGADGSAVLYVEQGKLTEDVTKHLQVRGQEGKRAASGGEASPCASTLS